MEHWCRCGPAPDAGGCSAVRLEGLLLQERCSTMLSVHRCWKNVLQHAEALTRWQPSPARWNIGSLRTGPMFPSGRLPRGAHHRAPRRAAPLAYLAPHGPRLATRAPTPPAASAQDATPAPHPTNHGPRLTPPTTARTSPHQPRPASHPTNHGPHLTPPTTARTSPHSQRLTCSRLAAYYQHAAKRLPISRRSGSGRRIKQYQGAQHVGHQASRGHHRPR
jgi:hypothetical protein